ncbi:MAG: hypothetical protein ABI459_00450 [Deltaproteobacteria bacterium]
MSLLNNHVTQDLTRRVVFSLLAGVLGLVAIAFLTTAAWIALAEGYSTLIAATVIGATYLLLALLMVLLKPSTYRPPEANNVGIGLALSASFVEGFSAARRVKR